MTLRVHDLVVSPILERDRFAAAVFFDGGYRVMDVRYASYARPVFPTPPVRQSHCPLAASVVDDDVELIVIGNSAPPSNPIGQLRHSRPYAPAVHNLLTCDLGRFVLPSVRPSMSALGRSHANTLIRGMSLRHPTTDCFVAINNGPVGGSLPFGRATLYRTARAVLRDGAASPASPPIRVTIDCRKI